jgi:hypothetical protein
MARRLSEYQFLSIVVCPAPAIRHPAAEPKAALERIVGTNCITETLSITYRRSSRILFQAPNWSGAASINAVDDAS